MKKSFKALFFISWLVALLDVLYLIYIHVFYISLGESACGFKNTISCTALGHPKFSKIASVPISVFALFILLSILLCALKYFSIKDVSENQSQNRKAAVLRQITSALCLLNVLASIFYAIVSVTVIKSICPYCLVFYISSFCMFLFWIKISADHWQGLQSIIKGDLRFVKSKAFICIVILGLAWSLVSWWIFKQDSSQFSLGSGQDITINASDSLRTLGQASAPVVIHKYSDFECGHCERAGKVLKDIARQSSGQVKLIYKFYPLDTSCNRAGFHKNACSAARHAVCASQQNMFWPYHDLVFANQTSLSPKNLMAFAEQLSLNMSDFQACIKDSKSIEVVKEDIKQGDKLLIEATPTVFINGKRFKGAITYQAIRKAIAQQ